MIVACSEMGGRGLKRGQPGQRGDRDGVACSEMGGRGLKLHAVGIGLQVVPSPALKWVGVD